MERIEALNSDAKRYVREVRKGLRFCPKEHRQAFIGRLQADLQDMAEDKPTASFRDLCARFGSPSLFAENLLENMERAEIDQEKRRRRRARIIFIAVLLAAVLILALDLLYVLQHKGAYTIVETVIYTSSIPPK